MFNLIRDNIKNFLDVTVFIAMIGIGLFTILYDYRYFKKTGFRKDASVTLVVGVICIALPFALFLISRL
jgi:TRAP-type C4-dicarboxylate transport system permease small subunit